MQLLNVKEGQVFGYQLLRIKGYSEGASNVSVSASSQIAAIDFHQKYFKALVLLSVGRNTINFQNDKGQSIQYHCTYDPKLVNVSVEEIQQGTSKRYCRIVYFVPKGDAGNFLGPPDVRCDLESAKQRLKMAGLMMQLFCAQNFEDLGHPSSTFGFEVDNKGEPVVTVFKSKRNVKEWSKLYANNDGGVFAWQTKVEELKTSVAQEYPPLDFTIFSASGYDKQKKQTTMATALGGFPLALFAGITMHCWANSVQQIFPCFKNANRIDTTILPDDSCFRHTYWANYATCLGAFMHEAGHGFGLYCLSSNCITYSLTILLL